MRTTQLVLSILLSLVYYAFSLDNGLGLTPPMGYNTWNDFRCDNITANTIKAAADAIVRQGLDKIGYVYVNIDDCWAKERDATGKIVPDPQTFPNGMKPVADYVHSKGLKFGIYTDRGTMTCGTRPGSFNYETIDANTYAEWGVDYLKEDSCYAVNVEDVAFYQYGLMRDALNKTGRPIFFSLCGWAPWYAPVGSTLGNSWRIEGDCNTWSDVIRAINANAILAPFAGPGGWNDPDMLIGTNPKSAAYLTVPQSRTMFAMWCLMSAPLLIGSSILQLNAADYETFSNTELIAVNQDPLGKQGTRLVGSKLDFGKSYINIWGKMLSDASRVLIFLNNGLYATNITCDSNCFASVGISKTDTFIIRDLWLHQNIGKLTGATYTALVPPNGASVVLRFSEPNNKISFNK